MRNADLPAMPIEFSGFGLYAPEAHAGLTKREIFAMHAMQGLLSGRDSEEFDFEGAAIYAVSHADALLIALEKTK